MFPCLPARLAEFFVPAAIHTLVLSVSAWEDKAQASIQKQYGQDALSC